MAQLSAAPRDLVLVAALAAAALPTMYGSHPGEGARHWVAAGIASVAGLSVVAALIRSRRAELIAVTLALCSAAAATVHFAVISEHVKEYVLFGVFFALAGLAQLLFAVLVLERPSRFVHAAGAVGNAGIVGMWVVSRMTGLPLGPEAGRAEAVGTADVVATALEVAIVAGCVALLLRPLRLAVRSSMLAVLLLAALALTTTALLSVDATRAHGDGGQPPGHEHHDR